MDHADAEKTDDVLYQVVSNSEGQYSIWRIDRPIPNGWGYAGVTAPKHECLDHIKNVWKDLRPLSLVKKMEALDDGTRSFSS